MRFVLLIDFQLLMLHFKKPKSLNLTQSQKFVYSFKINR